MHKFLPYYVFNSDIDVVKRELEATKQLSNGIIVAFISRWMAKVVEMIEWPKQLEDKDNSENLQLRYEASDEHTLPRL